MKTQSPAVLRPAAAAHYLGFGLSTIWRKAKNEPEFPQPFKMSERCTVWRVADLDAYIARRAEASA